MSLRAIAFMALGLATGLLLGRVLPDVWWVNVLTLGALVGVWLAIRRRRARERPGR